MSTTDNQNSSDQLSSQRAAVLNLIDTFISHQKQPPLTPNCQSTPQIRFDLGKGDEGGEKEETSAKFVVDDVQQVVGGNDVGNGNSSEVKTASKQMNHQTQSKDVNNNNNNNNLAMTINEVVEVDDDDDGDPDDRNLIQLKRCLSGESNEEVSNNNTNGEYCQMPSFSSDRQNYVQHTSILEKDFSLDDRRQTVRIQKQKASAGGGGAVSDIVYDQSERHNSIQYNSPQKSKVLLQNDKISKQDQNVSNSENLSNNEQLILNLNQQAMQKLHNTEKKNPETPPIVEFKYNQVEVQDIDFPGKVSALTKLSDGIQSASILDKSKSNKGSMVQASDSGSRNNVGEFNSNGVSPQRRGTMQSTTDAKSFLTVEKHRDIIQMMRDEQEKLQSTNQDLVKKIMEMKKKEKRYKDEHRENAQLKEKVVDLQGRLQKAVKFLDTYKKKEQQWKSNSYKGSNNSKGSSL